MKNKNTGMVSDSVINFCTTFTWVLNFLTCPIWKALFTSLAGTLWSLINGCELLWLSKLEGIGEMEIIIVVIYYLLLAGRTEF